MVIAASFSPQPQVVATATTAGHTLIGLDGDFGLIWPRPVSAFDVDHTWLSRFSIRIALFVGFEMAGG